MATMRRFVVWAVMLLVPAGPGVLAQGDPDAAWRLTLLGDGEPGTPLELRGRVTGRDGRPVPEARVSVRHADDGGAYGAHAGTMITSGQGEYVLRTVFPGSYGRPRHIHMTVTHPGHAPVFTEVLFKGDPILGGEYPPNAIVTEEAHVGERRVLVGNFDVVLEPN